MSFGLLSPRFRGGWVDMVSPINRLHPLARGLVAAYCIREGMQGGARLIDLNNPGPYGNHGTLTNMDPATDWVWVPELGRWGLDFGNIQGKSVNLPSIALSGLTNTITVSAWMRRPTAKTGITTLIWTGTNWDNGLHFGRNSDNAVFYPYSYTANGVSATVSDWTKWVHVAGRLNAGYADLFVNGALVSSADLTAQGNITVTNLELSRNIVYYYNEFASDECIWLRALTNPEIKTLADKSDPMLGGLILPLRRRLWGAVSVTTRARIIGSGTGHILGA